MLHKARCQLSAFSFYLRFYNFRFYDFRHCRALAALGPAPIESACPKTSIPMLVLGGRSLRRPGEAPQFGVRGRRGCQPSTAADAAVGVSWRPSTRKSNLAPLAVHQGHPLGSVDRSQTCKGMHTRYMQHGPNNQHVAYLKNKIQAPKVIGAAGPPLAPKRSAKPPGENLAFLLF